MSKPSAVGRRSSAGLLCSLRSACWPTHRSLCRTLFLLVCVGPTLLVASWTIARSLPGAQSAGIEEIGRNFGLRIECERLETPQPGVVRLSGVALLEPESNHSLAKCDHLEARRNGNAWILIGNQLQVNVERLRSLGERLERALRSDWAPAVECRFKQVRLVDAGEPMLAWRHVAASLSSAIANRGREFTLTAAAEHAEPAGEPLRLIVSRNRQIDPPATRFSLETGESPVPWRLLARLAPGSGAIGNSAQFSGKLTTTLGESRQGSLEGTLQDVAIDQYLGRDTPTFALNEPAKVEIARLAWSGERLVELQATVEAGAGAADRRFITAANSGLRCGASDVLFAEFNSTQRTTVAFDQLAFSVAIDADGLQLRGACRDATGGVLPCVLARCGAPLLYHPSEERLDPAALLGLVARPDAPLRPSGRVADALARHLPLVAEPAARQHR